MPIRQIVKKLSSFLNLLIAVLAIVLVGAFFYLQREKPNVQETVAVAPAPVMDLKAEDQMVNKYLQRTAQDLERQKMLSERSLKEARARLEELEQRKKNDEQSAAQSVPLERQIWKEPARESAQEILDAEISEAQSQVFSGEAEKEEYKRQFIENARRGGYYIELSDDLEVIQAVPIRKPSQEQERDAVETQPME